MNNFLAIFKVTLLLSLSLHNFNAIARNKEKTEDNILYTKQSLLITVPLMFKDYAKLLQQSPAAEYIYPGSFYIGSDSRIYIQYVFNPKTVNNVIVVYSKSGVYEGYYLISNGGPGVAGEGLVVTKNKNNEMTIYAGTTNGIMKSYSLTDAKYGDLLPSNKSYDLNLYNQFTFYKGKWLIESIERFGDVTSRTSLVYLDNNFKPIKKIKLNIKDSGYITDTTTRDAKEYNKRQGLSLCGNYLVAGYGAYYSKIVKDTTNTYQGIKTFDSDGNDLSQFMYNPKKLISKFNDIGLKATRIENEGVACSNDGKDIFSIFIYSDRKHPKIAKNEGIAIFKSQIIELVDGNK